MRKLNAMLLLAATLTFFACDSDDDFMEDKNSEKPEKPVEEEEQEEEETEEPINTTVNFEWRSSIKVGGEGASEISAYDAASKKLFIVNVENNQISVFNLTNLDSPVEETAISMAAYGSPNSVDVYDGKLAVAVENEVKQDPGSILLFNTEDHSLIQQFTVGALPDMVTFTKDGKTILSANEGEPNDDYTVDPEGTISIITLEDMQVTTIDFTAFNDQQADLEAQGFRVFGPGANLAQDVEPEYIATSADSKTAWVSLQENNGMAKVNITTKTIEAIYPLGFKDYSLAENAIDASDKDDVKELKNWPVYGIYMPDAVVAANINGTEYIFSANEGDSRDYDGFSEEERIEDITLDASVFDPAMNYQTDEKIGRLEITTTLGDTDNDGEYEALYSYGGRSFSVWSAQGSLVYDSGNSIARETLAATPDRFNDDDKRSDAKGAEPEAVEILNMGDERYILFVGLERNDQVLVYDVTNPAAPVFLAILAHAEDEAPEGLLVIPAADSPNNSDLLIVSNEDSGTVSIYENKQ